MSIEEAKKFFNEGTAHYNNARYDESIESYTKSIKILGSSNDILLNNIGKNIRNIRKSMKYTIDDLADISGLSGKYVQGVEVGSRRISIKNLSKITKSLNISLKDLVKDVDYANPKSGMSNLYFDEYDKIIELEFSAYFYRGLSHNEKREYDLSILDFNKAIEIKPKHEHVYYNRGSAYTAQGKYEEAIKDFEKLSTDEKYYNIAQLMLGRVYEEKKDYNKALEYYEKPQPDDPNYPLAQVNIGRVKGLLNPEIVLVNKKLTEEYIEKITELNKSIDKNQPLFTKYTWVSVGIVFLVLAGNITLTILKIEFDWLMINISGTSMAALFLWIARYFNRRVHEDIHIKEEYEHRKILIEMFETYSGTIQKLAGNDKTSLLDFIQKISTAISKSPANSLNRKKGDNMPTTEVLEIIQNIQKK